MSQSFDVLDPSVDIQRNYLLEASAGTGKTFAIENIYVRLLQEPFRGGPDGLTIDQIGVMTFTKAAARDLKKRIRSIIARKKNESLHLQEALYTFDQAHIFTLHGFCGRSLKMLAFESGLSFEKSTEEELTSRQALKQIVHDALRMELPGLSPVQITLLVEKHKHRQEQLEEELIDLLEKRGSIVPPPPIGELFEAFQEGVAFLTKESFKRLEQDYGILSRYHKNGDRTQRERSVVMFTALLQKERCTFAEFEAFLPFWSFFKECFNPETLNKTKKIKEPLAHPNFFSQLLTSLNEPMEFATNPAAIQAALAAKCQQLHKVWEAKQANYGPDQLLEEMRKAVCNPIFAAKIRERYRAIIVDEFQDTDPIQWEILQKLFLVPEYKGLIYLVGDPKQAIYAFRKGDVYTYLAAAKALGSEAVVSLKTNYRSLSPLVEALNILFGSAKNLFALPRLNEEIPYQPVYAGKEAAASLDDGKGPLHFLEIEKRGHNCSIPDVVYEAIAEEIHKFKEKSIAILVSSASQGVKITEILKKWNIPSFTQKAPPLSKSPVVPALVELLQAVISPRKLSNLKLALGGILIGWDVHQVQQLDNLEVLENCLTQFYQLRKILLEKGIASFIQHFLRTTFHGMGKGAGIHLLEKERGDALFQNLMQLEQILTQYQSAKHCTAEGLIARLKEIIEEEEEGLRQLLQTKAHVQIITIHSSKGLEFDVVFAPGVLSPQRREDLPFVSDEKGALHPIVTKQSNLLVQRHQEEMDGERMRLFYVALTRAKERVVVPICLDGKGDSPWDLFLKKMETPLHALLSENITLEKIKENYPLPLLPTATEELLPPPTITVPGHPRFLHSFSSLAKTVENTLHLVGAPTDLQNSSKTIHTLPSSSEIGNLFHQLFEKIPFTANRLEIEKLLSEKPILSSLKEWEGVFCDAIYNTYHTKLPLKTGLKALSEMGNLACYKEMEFCYPTPEGYIKGVIDLLFFYEGYYYLLDWKSNWLGKQRETYSAEALEEAMQNHNYHLQSLVYRNALECYLSRIDPRPFEEIYGGMFYLFFRGMHPEDPLQKGIYRL